MDNNTKWIVRGYEFTTEEETKTACLEYSKIKQLEKKIDYKNPKMVYQLYNKAVDGKIFKTVIGYEYLRKLQKYLLDKSEDGTKIKPIPVSLMSVEVQREHIPQRQSEKQSVVKEKQKSNQLLVYCVVVLAIMVVAMFVITMTGDRPTILNYERALQNKYAQWEEELQQRENAIKEKERELRIVVE